MSQTTQVEQHGDAIEVLLLDDDPEFAETAAKMLEEADADFAVRTRTTPEQALAELETTPIDAIVSDYRMPERDGLDVLEAARSVDPSLPFFLLTGYGSEAVASEAISAGVTDYFQKAGDSDQYTILANRIRNAVATRRAERSLREREAFFRQVFDGVQDGLAVVDANRKIVRANAWLERKYEGDLVGRPCRELLEHDGPGEPAAVIESALETGSTRQMEVELAGPSGPFWAVITAEPLAMDQHADGDVLIQVTDISDRKRRERKLRKRERLSRNLHEHTKVCLEADTRGAVFDVVLDGMTSSLGYDRVAILGYQTETGTLAVERRTDSIENALGRIQEVRPGDDPLWETFHDGRTRVIDATALESQFERGPEPGSEFVAVAIGDHALILAHRTETVEFGDIDLEILELCSANAGVILDRIRKAGKLGSANTQISAQADRIESLQELIAVVAEIHRTIPATETRDGMERTVTEKLVETDVVDFAWIGRPESVETHLNSVAWAGRDAGLLDAVDFTDDTELTPPQRAARDREPVIISNSAEHLQDATWAKEAITANYGSIASLPIEYDDVLYGVLTVYAGAPGTFDTNGEILLSEVSALLAAYIGIQNRRDGMDQASAVEVELTISDANEPLYALAKALNQPVRFEAVHESLDDSARIIVSVPKESTDSVLETASALSKVQEARWFGDGFERKVLLELDRPFLGTDITTHGARLVRATADETGTRAVVVTPRNQVRPLIEWLRGTYSEIALLAKREKATSQEVGVTDPEQHLTGRQLEILEAAYQWGYFETPRKITGEDLAESFEISGSAVYKHLRAAQKRLFDRLFGIDSENEGFDS